MALSVIPVLNDLAFIVVVVPTDIGLEYGVDDIVGSEPSSIPNSCAAGAACYGDGLTA